jgi:hypothetical protein
MEEAPHERALVGDFPPAGGSILLNRPDMIIELLH